MTTFSLPTQPPRRTPTPATSTATTSSTIGWTARVSIAVVATTVALAVSSSADVMGTSTAQTPTCSNGDSCYGLDPRTTHCEDDAVTVAEEGVTFPDRGDFGLLQIRYSAACSSYWGRYTAPAGIRQVINVGGWNPTYGRVTAWIPNLKSIPTAGTNPGWGGSSWTGMVQDIGPGVCTGVEVVLSNNPGMAEAPEVDTMPWFWGPCTNSTTAIAGS